MRPPEPPVSPTGAAREVKGFRIDLLIAVSALFVSTLATGASWWQSRVVQQQLSAQVWPYLSFDTTAGDDALKLAVINYGTGPALIRDIVMTVDGIPQHDLAAGLIKVVGDPRSLARTKTKGRRNASVQLSSIQPGSVVRSSESRTMLDIVNSPALAQRLIAGRHRIDVRICYCSILEQCWAVSLSDLAAQPHAATCDAHDPNALQEFDLRDVRNAFSGATGIPRNR